MRRDDGSHLALKLLRLMGWVPPASTVEQVDSPYDDPVCDNEGATQATIAYVRTPERLSWPVPDKEWQDGEARALAHLAALTAEGGSPWDAAMAVFGGRGVARDATGTGLSGTVGREPGLSVPR